MLDTRLSLIVAKSTNFYIQDRKGSTEFYDENEPVQTMWQSKMETSEFQQFDQFALVGFKDLAFLFGGKHLHREGDTDAVWRLHGDFLWDRESYTLSQP